MASGIRRRRLAVFAFVCSNLAMLPCAMAIGGGPMHGDAHVADAHAHHSHDVTHGSHAVEADCCDLGSASIDDRPTPKKPDFSADLTTTASDASGWRIESSAGRLHTTTDPPARRRGAPRLHVINCVYLD